MSRVSASDRRAIVALCCIAVFATGVLLVVDALKEKKQDDVIAFEEKKKEFEEKKQGGSFIDEEAKNVDIRLTPFNPNTIDSLSLIRMGLTERKVRSFLHYRNAGKTFRSAEDVGKTYGWTEEDIVRLRPYMRFASTERSSSDRRSLYANNDEEVVKSNNYDTRTLVDANTADSATICRIPGIGAKTARWIVHYRQRIGGFYSVNQLLDIPIVSADMLEWFTVSESDIKPLDINTASFRQLNLHPYITYEQAKQVSNYKRLYGKFADEDALRSSAIFTADELEKLKPYLIF